jgi:aldose 1-epimerase
LIALERGPARVVLDPDGGGRIERLVVDGLALLVPPEVDDHNYGCFPMAPWAGRVRDGRFSFEGVEHQLPLNKPPHAIHGIARDRRWRVQEQSPSRAVLTVDLGDPWPFRGRVVHTLALTADSLDLTMEVDASGSTMPASCGWHPWWHRGLARGEPVELELHAGAMYVRDADGIPTGELTPVAAPPWDDCFTDLGAPAAAVLRWPGAATLTIRTDCPCVVVYTEPETAVCVEPQSGPPDELNLAPHVVTTDAPLVVHATFDWALDG